MRTTADKTDVNNWEVRYRGRKVLVLGAGGFIGRWIARGLTSVGADLWLSGRNSRNLQAICSNYDVRGRLVECDLAQEGAFAELYQEVQPDITFNLVGYGVDPAEREHDLLCRLNQHLVSEIAEVVSLRRNGNWLGLRLVHAGSGAEYGSSPGPLTETSTPAPVNAYGQAKLAGTRALVNICDRTGLRAVTARLFTVYGPGEHSGRLLPSLTEAANSGAPVRLTQGEQQRDFTYIGDVAEGLLRLGCLESPIPPVVNLATGVLTSVRLFAEQAAELMHLNAAQLQFGALPSRPDELRHGAVDVALLRQVLNWAPVCTVRTGIALTIGFQSRVSKC